jgi:hypothetical protein
LYVDDESGLVELSLKTGVDALKAVHSRADGSDAGQLHGGARRPDVNLRWQTSLEQDNYGFLVHRSSVSDRAAAVAIT